MDPHTTKINIHDNIWHFSVTDPQLHKKKFTIYKVICKTFPIKSPETLTEIVCWKRYNDFKTLYKSLFALHKALHRREPFPEFAKPKLFGRFEDPVIEERRQSALDLLNFISGQPHLYKSVIFKQFIDDGKAKASNSLKHAPLALRSSSTLDVLSGDSSLSGSDGKPPPDIVPILSPQLRLDSSNSSVPVDEDLSPDSTMEDKNANTKAPKKEVECKTVADYRVADVTGLEGTWNFPQVADNISLDSSLGDETNEDTDDDSVMTQSLPDPELALFDPMASPGGTRLTSSSAVDDHEPHMTHSNSWLLNGLNLCAEMDTDGPVYAADEGAMEKGEGQKAHRSNTDFSNSSTLVCSVSVDSSSATDGEKEEGIDVITVPGLLDDDLEGFDPLRKMSESSTIECGKGDLDLSGSWDATRSHSLSLSQTSATSQSTQIESKPTSNDQRTKMRSQTTTATPSPRRYRPDRSLESTPTHNSKGLLQKLMSKSPKRSRADTDHSVSSMDLGGKEDYIYLAASQISMAQNSEANGDFEVAFAYYKSGVGILLQGVQGDSNKSRRDAVRRKTAQYLMKAEDLFNRHLASEDVNERRWGVDSYLSPSLDLDPSLAFIRGSVKDLRNFQVLGIVDRVILIRDKATDETFVIKSIHKSPATDTGNNRLPSILPTSCPFMVSLHKFYETDNAIYLLLQYASGGKLWTYVGDYLSGEHSMQTGGIQFNFGVDRKDSGNIYSGCKLDNEGDDDKTAEKEKNIHCAKPGISEISSSGVSAKDETVASENHNSNKVQSSGISGAVRFSSVIKADGKSVDNDAIVDEVANHDDPNMDDVNISSTTPGEELSFNRQLSSFSDDSSSHIYDIDNTPLSPPSPFHDDNHFQSLLQTNRSNMEAFSINSIDSEDNRRLSTACFERIDSIAEDQEPQSDSMRALDISNDLRSSEVQRQLSEDEVFISEENMRYAPTFNSSDIVQSSKQLIKDVDRVLYETDHKKVENDETKHSNSSQDSTVENPNSNVSSEIEEPSIYDSNRYSGTSSSDVSQSDKKTSSMSEAQKVSDSDTSESSDKTSKPLDDRFEKLFSAADSDSSFRPRINSANAIFRQTSTPHKLSISRMNSKEMTRSASFECDLRSPTRNRARAVTDLFERLDSINQEQVRIPESSIRKWIAHIVTAVSRLHSLGIVCRDLNPSNILLAEGGTVYLTYFCHLGQGDQSINWEAVNDLYAAPELRSIGGYNMACDWWSIGALLYELVVGRSLRECHPGGINSHTCLHIPAFVSDESKGLLEGLLTFNPKERLGSGMAGCEEIKAHPFFAGIDWHVMESS